MTLSVQCLRYYDSYISTAITIQVNRITLHSVFEVEGVFARKMHRTTSHCYATTNVRQQKAFSCKSL